MAVQGEGEVVGVGELSFDDRGLIPAIMQDDVSGAVLMLGYMTRETLARTRELGQVVFWSRSRGEVWHKGATSGDFLEVVSMRPDCEGRSLLVRVRMLGGAVCHTGSATCYFRVISD